MDLKKEKPRFLEEKQDLESRAIRAEADAHSYQRQYDSLYKKRAAEFNKLVEAYQQSDAFLKFMDEHDDELRPVNMSIGWNKAVQVAKLLYEELAPVATFPIKNIKPKMVRIWEGLRVHHVGDITPMLEPNPPFLGTNRVYD